MDEKHRMLTTMHSKYHSKSFDGKYENLHVVSIFSSHDFLIDHLIQLDLLEKMNKVNVLIFQIDQLFLLVVPVGVKMKILIYYLML